MVDLSYRDIQGNLQEKQETANSYVISKPGEYCFPLIMGNGIKSGETNYLAFTNQKLSEKQADFYDYLDRIITSPEIVRSKSVDIISWDSSREFIQNLRIEGDYVKFIITWVPDDGANYIVSVKESNRIVIWSWHLWLWKDKLKNIDVDKYKILNTNLASKKLNNKLVNWFYQWGRKDPICFFDKMVNIKECSETVGQSIQHPDIFYLHGDNYNYNYNWIKKKFYYNYWNSRCNKEQVDEKVIKTIYDPCPPGYSIPGYMVFTNLKKDHWDKDRKGWIFINSKISLPASGYRSGDDGGAGRVGDCGYYWSAGTVYEDSASLLNFNDDDVFPLNLNDRSYGYSVRPQLEEI